MIKLVEWFTSLSRGPEVGHGEAADGRSLQSGEVSSSVQQEYVGPNPLESPADDQNLNPGKSFLGQHGGKR